MASIAAETATGEAQLYERHSDLVYRYCLRMLGSREDAEDAAQTTFFQALRALRRGVIPTFEQAWLLTIARNECKSRYRAGSRRRQREFAHDPQSLAEVAEAPNGGDGRLIGVRQALSCLPEAQRRALLLREWQGRSYAEIAHELGVSRPAVEALLFRARRGLARELGEETRERRHALDFASLLATLKTALGGSAAVKLAAGVAAVATVGTVAAGSGQTPAPTVPVQNTAKVERSVAAPTRAERGDVAVVAAPSLSRKPVAKAAPAAKPTPAARRTGVKPASPAPSAPAAPSAPRAGQSAPPSAPIEAPQAPPVAAPPLPTAPELPTAPTPPPAVQLPAVPPLPEVPLPQVQVPPVQVPQLPVDVPDVPLLPEVPDLPVVGDVPILP